MGVSQNRGVSQSIQVMDGSFSLENHGDLGYPQDLMAISMKKMMINHLNWGYSIFRQAHVKSQKRNHGWTYYDKYCHYEQKTWSEENGDKWLVST